MPPAKAVAKKAAPVKAVKNGKAAAKQESDDDEESGKSFSWFSRCCVLNLKVKMSLLLLDPPQQKRKLLLPQRRPHLLKQVHLPRKQHLQRSPTMRRMMV